MLLFIVRGNDYKSRKVMLQLYRELVRPHLECCVQYWSPYLRKDVNVLEAVLRRFTRLIPGIDRLSYEGRLDRVSLYHESLEE